MTAGRRGSAPSTPIAIPGLHAEEWVSAATLADRVLAAALLRGRDTSLWIRLLRDEHFEFRGGGGRLVPDAGERPRREDR